MPKYSIPELNRELTLSSGFTICLSAFIDPKLASFEAIIIEAELDLAKKILIDLMESGVIMALSEKTACSHVKVSTLYVPVVGAILKPEGRDMITLTKKDIKEFYDSLI